MNELIINRELELAQGFEPSAVPTMSSNDLLEIVNDARKEYGEPEIRRNKFAEKIEAELEGEHYTKSVVTNQNGTESVVYDLTRDQCLLISMRESRSVRRKVIERLKEIRAPAVPQSLPEALRLAADLAEKAEALQYERDEAIRTKAQIGSRREATAMATAAKKAREVERLRSELGRNQHHATIIAVEQVSGAKFERNAYVPLRRWCKQRGVKPVEVMDERYGMVKAWPAGAWMDCHGVDLASLFGRSK